MNSKFSQAVVIGGSMAGMLAARVLSDHFDKVTLVERDHYPTQADYRNGVPQARHLHVLLVRGMRILEKLFPGIDAELEAEGAQLMRWGVDTLGRFPNGWQPEYVSDYQTRAGSRAMLDYSVRLHLLKIGNIRILEETQVNSLLTSEDKSQVTGVRVQSRKGDRAVEVLNADLVVDASGRGTNTPDWLKALGYGEAEVSVVNSFLGYATRWYKLNDAFKKTSKFMLIQSVPPHIPRGGGIMQVEGEQMVVTLAGAAREYPPTDEAGFLEFARSLPSKRLYDIIKDAEPTSPIYGYQRTANQLRHFENMARWPENFVVMGDAACAFNPIYGQGMTAAAIGAEILDESLRFAQGDLRGVAHRFQKNLAKATEPIWLLATGEDFRYPTTEGKRSGLMMRFTHWYTDQLLYLMRDNPDVIHAFIEVMNILKPPTYLMQPRIAFKVLRHVLTGGKKARENKRSTQQVQTVN
jgi:2-polyprenyl-6-methoxyphenol hydroxylase-like FAD-dependent oxidoreductase